MMVKYRGTFDFIGLYNLLFSWLRDRNYRPVEKKHKEKAGGDGREVEIELIGRLEVTEYVDYIAEFAIHVWDMKTIEVKEGDQVKKMDWGRLEVKLKGGIIVDPKNKIPKGGGLYKAMDTFLNKVALWRELEFMHEDNQMIIIGKVQVMVKKFLNMDSGESAFGWKHGTAQYINWWERSEVWGSDGRSEVVLNCVSLV